MINKKDKRVRRHKRIRSRVVGTAKRPRLAVFRSLKNIYVQAIDDAKGVTLASADDTKLDTKKTKTDRATEVGKMIASNLKVKEVVFDRGGFIYAGRVKALADSARENGLKF